MNNNNSGTGSLVCGIIGLVVSVISWIACGWLGFIGAVLGLIGLILPAQGFGMKVPALLAFLVGLAGGGFWAIMLAVMAGA
jgi:hypothetical protein